MKKIGLLIGLSLSAFVSFANAASIDVSITASTIVNNIPSAFFKKQFALLRPWELDEPPAFVISSAATTTNMHVNALNNMPALEITENDHGNLLSWFYYCDGLHMRYGNDNNQATIQFSGSINDKRPGTGVTCSCEGSACSTTQSVPARLIVR